MQDFSTLIPAGMQHTQIKQYLAVKNNTMPTTHHLACIEGVNMLSQALHAGVNIHALFVCPSLLRNDLRRQLALHVINMGVPSFLISEKVLTHLVEWEGPDGLTAIVQLPQHSWDALELRQHNSLLVLDGLQIPGNIGTIIRCADGAGIDGIIITGRKHRLSHPKLVRASMGSLFSFPVLEMETSTALAWLQRHHFKLVITDTGAQLNYRQFDYQGRVAVIMGNERNGVSQPWYDAQHTSVSIPMHGRADSLNVGNASVLMLYEMVHHQRG